jgi:predicted nuclease with TOPRIM domain
MDTCEDPGVARIDLHENVLERMRKIDELIMHLRNALDLCIRKLHERVTECEVETTALNGRVGHLEDTSKHLDDRMKELVDAVCEGALFS